VATEQLATRYVADAEALREKRPLRAFARAGCTQ
jgi:hypothetical protein